MKGGERYGGLYTRVAGGLNMWLVSIDALYYPDVLIFSNYEEAKKEYNKQIELKKKDEEDEINIYLSEVKLNG